MIYISAPYTHKDISVIDNRMTRVTKYSAHLLLNGEHIICPLTMGHAFSYKKQMPNSQEFWMKWCYALLSKCDVMHVLLIPGWEISDGVQKEIKYCEENNIKIIYVSLENVERLLY